MLDLSRLEALRRAGASNESLVQLINIQGENLSTADLRSVLSFMGDDYERVSQEGNGVVRFALGQGHEELLKRLEGVTHTGAKRKQTTLHGTKLEANLKLAVS